MTPLTAFCLGIMTGLLVGLVIWTALTAPARRARLEAEARASREEVPVPAGIDDVLGVLRSGGIVLDRTNKVRSATASAIAFGLVRDRLLVHPELREQVAQVQRDGSIREGEFVIARGPLGSGRILIGTRVAPISDGFVLILVDDRTQAHRVEEVRRDFVVNVSHELKTPVGGLALLAEAVQDASDDPEAVHRFAGRMKTEAARLSRLVSEIVDLSRLQTSDILADMVIVDVGDCAAEAVDQSSIVAGQREILAIGWPEEEGLRVYGDHDLIVTAIRNLVANAIAYSEDGTRVTVVTRRSGDLVEVAVTDQGQGIPEQDQARIFERFYRVDSARSRQTGGTGLGLSIVKHICANHGGTIRVWSQEGHGSTFTIQLPAIAGDDRPPGSPAPHTAGHPRRVADPAHGNSLPPGGETRPGQSRKALR